MSNERPLTEDENQYERTLRFLEAEDRRHRRWGWLYIIVGALPILLLVWMVLLILADR
jgi:predicted nucleic acid-binding Zn ribbon protein